MLIGLIVLTLCVVLWFSVSPGAGIVVATLTLIALAASPYVRIWHKAEEKKDFARFQWTDHTDLKEASSYLQSGITVLVLLGGVGWGVYTWILQNQNYRASLVPALQVRISAEQESLQNQEDFLGRDFLAKNPNARLIKRFVTIKNVGTSTTSLQVCECVKPEKIPETNEDRDVFIQLCEKLKATNKSKDLWQVSQPSCEDGQPRGPIVISRVHLHDDKMLFTQTGRFWLTRSSVDRRSDVESTDEIRPNAKDKFEFLEPISKISPHKDEDTT